MQTEYGMYRSAVLKPTRENNFVKWNEEFRARFGLSKVQLILDKLRVSFHASEKKTTALTAEERLLITLRYLAKGAILQVLGDFTVIDEYTAIRMINKVFVEVARLGR
ncbi:hypothetical protein JTB14_001384 [Gonioctena quinquepunctata]|nr:hypothetical protein JTB14_001384 [Gonioctena quinquepunctata]